jgi:phosphohistidine phosphatase
MKILFLVRHAKSVNHFTATSDFNRSLNEKGFKDAAEMAKRLVKKNIMIDQFVSSMAVRAKTTAEVFISQYNRKPEEIRLIPELYHATPEVFEQVTSHLDDQFDHVAVFAHNPGITDYASSLTQTHIANMPTCSIFAVTSKIKSWQDFPFAEKEFLFFDSPKSA